jgi:hypothetical protein
MFRTVRSLRLLRQLLTIAIALTFSVNVLEAAAPDVHDGGAVAVMLAHPDGGNTSGDQHRSPHGTPQGAHVEHCGHAHIAEVAAGPQLDTPDVALPAAPIMPIATLESVAMPPAFRPPIALS